MAASTDIVPGLPEPARNSQLLFRRILDAIAYAGRIETIDLPLQPPAGLGSAAAALVLTLVDADVDLWLSESLRAPLTPWVRFHCGCPVVLADGLDCAFALAAAGDPLPPLATARLADPERPDISTTLIVECAALAGGRRLRATGPGIGPGIAPGIDGERIIAPSGLPAELLRERAALRPLLPLGVDLFLTAGPMLMALPRYTHIEEMD
jgi:alpha-D-ribose 1-methylphosphonate 5-triphosphate synthase subunit PhnH